MIALDAGTQVLNIGGRSVEPVDQARGEDWTAVEYACGPDTETSTLTEWGRSRQ